MNKITFLAILMAIFLNLTSCTTNTHLRISPNHPGVDAELDGYLKNFVYKSKKTVTKKDLKDLTIGFKRFSPESNIAGLCYITPFFREIDINIDYWESTTIQEQREELMFHELGHCILYRAHTAPTRTYGIIGWFEGLLFELSILEDKGRLLDGCPVSYMYPSVIGSFCIEKHYKYYMDEMYEKRYSLPGYEMMENKTFIRYQNNECK